MHDLYQMQKHMWCAFIGMLGLDWQCVKLCLQCFHPEMRWVLDRDWRSLSIPDWMRALCSCTAGAAVSAVRRCVPFRFSRCGLQRLPPEKNRWFRVETKQSPCIPLHTPSEAWLWFCKKTGCWTHEPTANGSLRMLTSHIPHQMKWGHTVYISNRTLHVYICI